MYLIYGFLYIVGLSFLLPVHFMKRPRRLRMRWLKERFGRVPPWTGDAGRQGLTLWIHAVSVGEAMAARPLIERFREGAHIVVSTVTDTGQKVVRDFIAEGERSIYAPFDIPSAVRGTVRRLSPDVLLIMETELWPNLIRTVRTAGVPVVIVNGRISEKSFAGYRRLRPFMKEMLGLVDFFCMQTARDAERIVALGAPEEKVEVTGNLKFDISRPDAPPAWCAGGLGRPVIVAGSTHEGEEEIILQAFREVKGVFAGATLVLAPRHPERFGEVEEILRKGRVSFVRRSDGGSGNKGDVILLDTIGELPSVYGCADLCVIGGSLVPKGGHNLFEPACWGKPVVCGPHMENFPLAEDFFSEGAAVVAERDELGRILSELLSDPLRAEDAGKKGRALYLRNSGALQKTADVIGRILGGRGSFLDG